MIARRDDQRGVKKQQDRMADEAKKRDESHRKEREAKEALKLLAEKRQQQLLQRAREDAEREKERQRQDKEHKQKQADLHAKQQMEQRKRK